VKRRNRRCAFSNVDRRRCVASFAAPLSRKRNPASTEYGNRRWSVADSNSMSLRRFVRFFWKLPVVRSTKLIDFTEMATRSPDSGVAHVTLDGLADPARHPPLGT
jgi:hypothetical protein